MEPHLKKITMHKLSEMIFVLQKTCVQRRVAGHKQSVRLFDWNKFKKKYIDED
jgi:hypothetical protein